MDKIKKQELIQILKECGISGAGGAGFPAYAKIDDRMETILLNCAECEPLLKVHRQLLARYAFEILSVLDLFAEAVLAHSIIIGVKKAYKEAVQAVLAELPSFPRVRIHYLPEVYPAGDEVILIYEATGKVVAPGSIPIESGIAVFNVETALNAYFAVKNGTPVTHKYVTIAGEVKNPCTLKLPLGMSVSQAVDLAGGVKREEIAYITGGPMTGNLVTGHCVITKTTNAILVLPKDHYVINRKNGIFSRDMKRAMASCCQCEMCTDLCPRNLLGHPIEPHAFMRAATSTTMQDVKPFLDTLYCSSCGLCEMYSCMQGLSPRSLITEYKRGLMAQGIRPEKGLKPDEVNLHREYRAVPVERLLTRLGLKPYDCPAPLTEKTQPTDIVKVQLSQHIGAPSQPLVKEGDTVITGQKIAQAKQNALSLPLHAPISGVVMEVNDIWIRIRKEQISKEQISKEDGEL